MILNKVANLQELCLNLAEFLVHITIILIEDKFYSMYMLLAVIFDKMVHFVS